MKIPALPRCSERRYLRRRLSGSWGCLGFRRDGPLTGMWGRLPGPFGLQEASERRVRAFWRSPPLSHHEVKAPRRRARRRSHGETARSDRAGPRILTPVVVGSPSARLLEVPRRAGGALGTLAWKTPRRVEPLQRGNNHGGCLEWAREHPIHPVRRRAPIRLEIGPRTS